MKARLDLILKELQDLKLRVDRLKSKFNKETLENRNIGEGMRALAYIGLMKMTFHRIKIGPPIFDDILGPKIFSDWMADLNYYFD